jgi:hypothetical protein
MRFCPFVETGHATKHNMIANLPVNESPGKTPNPAGTWTLAGIHSLAMARQSQIREMSGDEVKTKG